MIRCVGWGAGRVGLGRGGLVAQGRACLTAVTSPTAAHPTLHPSSFSHPVILHALNLFAQRIQHLLQGVGGLCPDRPRKARKEAWARIEFVPTRNKSVGSPARPVVGLQHSD